MWVFWHELSQVLEQFCCRLYLSYSRSFSAADRNGLNSLNEPGIIWNSVKISEKNLQSIKLLYYPFDCNKITIWPFCCRWRCFHPLMKSMYRLGEYWSFGNIVQWVFWAVYTEKNSQRYYYLEKNASFETATERANWIVFFSASRYNAFQ